MKRHLASTIASIALGSNLNRENFSQRQGLVAALAGLSRHPEVLLVAVSRFYRSPAFPAGSGPDYVNAAALLRTTLSPQDLLALLHETEALLGRERSTRWASRVIDLDLLWHGDALLPDAATQARWRALSLDDQLRETPETLILPHPRLAERAFVLVPLAEIAAAQVVPGLDVSVGALCAALPAQDRAEVTPLP